MKEYDPPIWFPGAQQGLVVWSVAKEVCVGDGRDGRMSENPVQKGVQLAVPEEPVHRTMEERCPAETATQERIAHLPLGTSDHTEPMVAERKWRGQPEDPEEVCYGRRTPHPGQTDGNSLSIFPYKTVPDTSTKSTG